MGFHRRTLPPVDQLVAIRQNMADDRKFLNLYWYKPDAITGTEESMNYMKNLIENEKRNWVELCKNGAIKILEGKISSKTFLNMFGLRVSGQISKAIANVYTPPLSVVTLMARKLRRKNKAVNIGELRQKLAKGDVDISGVSTKPLVDTGLMISTVTHIVGKE
jgi:hypothetical protein